MQPIEPFESDHDDATVGRIYSRREVLRWAAGTTLFAAISATSLGRFPQSSKGITGLIASPELTEGPFFVDEKLNRSNLLTGTTRTSVVNGSPLKIRVRVLKLVGSDFRPFSGAQVDLWHCDVDGKYSDVSAPMNHENTSGQNWLRGYQLTDDKGEATFQTIVPGWYPSRAPHIHFKVRKHDVKSNKTAELTSQMFFQTDELEPIYASGAYAAHGQPGTPNKWDSIFNERTPSGSTAGSQLLLSLKKSGDGYEALFTIVLTDKNFHPSTGRGRGPGGPGGPGDWDFDWNTF